MVFIIDECLEYNRMTQLTDVERISEVLMENQHFVFLN